MLSVYFKIMMLLFGTMNSTATNHSPVHHHHHCVQEIIGSEVMPPSTSFETSVMPPDTEEKRIKWRDGGKLTWDDFQAYPDYEDFQIAALTSSAISYRYYCMDDKLHVTVDAIFRKEESWVKPEAMTPHYLEHEQLHFDITELYARKLRKALKQEFKCYEKWKLEQIATEHLAAWRAAEKEYDLKTSYSLNEAKQGEWFIKVSNDLLDYDDFQIKEPVEPLTPLKYTPSVVIPIKPIQQLKVSKKK